jgi:predicted HicB family RNase H-like nuclease
MIIMIILIINIQYIEVIKEREWIEMADYILRGIDDKLWREVKAAAALQGVSIKDLIIKLLEKETKKLKK